MDVMLVVLVCVIMVVVRAVCIVAVMFVVVGTVAPMVVVMVGGVVEAIMTLFGLFLVDSVVVVVVFATPGVV